MTIFTTAPLRSYHRSVNRELNQATEVPEAEITGPDSPLNYTDFT